MTRPAWLRLINRVPWQVSAAAGWTGLASAGWIIEVQERESAAEAAAHAAGSSSSTTTPISAAAVATLRKQGYVVIDDMLPEAALAAARRDAQALKDSGELRSTDQHSAEVRSDRVCWVREEQPCTCGDGLQFAMRWLRSVALQIDTAADGGAWSGFASNPLWCGAVPLGVPRSAQLACYDAGSGSQFDDPEEAEAVQATGGARYRAHRDGVTRHPLHPKSAMLPGISMREITAIVYLTERTPDGAGAGSPLVLFVGADADDFVGTTATSVVEIEPRGGRLVLFDSRTLLHEVRPHARADADRLALTCWIGGAHEHAGCVARTGRWLWRTHVSG